MSFPGDPVGEVSQEEYSEDEEGGDIEQSVHPVAPSVPRLTGDDEELPAVQEDGVDLHEEGESHEGHELVGEHRHAVAEDDEAVVEQQLVGAPLAVVHDHVGRVVEEVADREADEAVAGLGGVPLQILLQAGSLGGMTVSAGQYSPLPPVMFYLVKSCDSPHPGDDGVDEAGGDVPPLPSLLLVAGGGWRDEDTSQEVDKEEGCGSRENSCGH